MTNFPDIKQTLENEETEFLEFSFRETKKALMFWYDNGCNLYGEGGHGFYESVRELSLRVCLILLLFSWLRFEKNSFKKNIFVAVQNKL